MSPSISLPHCGLIVGNNTTCPAGADSVEYLSVEGLVSAVQEGVNSILNDKVISSSNKSSKRVGHCTACLTGKYPVELEW